MSRPTTVPALILVVLTGALLTSGCGSAADRGPASSTASTGTAGQPSTTGGADYPITIERSGGLAGFADKVVVAEDGTAQVTTKSGTRTCTVTAQALSGLTRTAATATASATATAQHADAMTVTLTTSRGTVALPDGDLPATAPEVAALLEDLTKAPSERSTCR